MSTLTPVNGSVAEKVPAAVVALDLLPARVLKATLSAMSADARARKDKGAIADLRIATAVVAEATTKGWNGQVVDKTEARTLWGAAKKVRALDAHRLFD